MTWSALKLIPALENCVHGQFCLPDQSGSSLSRFLAEGCTIAYSLEDSVGKKIRDVYPRARYIPTAVYVDGRSLELRLRDTSRKSRVAIRELPKQERRDDGQFRCSRSPQES